MQPIIQIRTAGFTTVTVTVLHPIRTFVDRKGRIRVSRVAIGFAALGEVSDPISAFDSWAEVIR